MLRNIQLAPFAIMILSLFNQLDFQSDRLVCDFTRSAGRRRRSLSQTSSNITLDSTENLIVNIGLELFNLIKDVEEPYQCESYKVSRIQNNNQQLFEVRDLLELQGFSNAQLAVSQTQTIDVFYQMRGTLIESNDTVFSIEVYGSIDQNFTASLKQVCVIEIREEILFEMAFTCENTGTCELDQFLQGLAGSFGATVQEDQPQTQFNALATGLTACDLPDTSLCTLDCDQPQQTPSPELSPGPTPSPSPSPSPSSQEINPITYLVLSYDYYSEIDSSGPLEEKGYDDEDLDFYLQKVPNRDLDATETENNDQKPDYSVLQSILVQDTPSGSSALNPISSNSQNTDYAYLQSVLATDTEIDTISDQKDTQDSYDVNQQQINPGLWYEGQSTDNYLGKESAGQDSEFEIPNQADYITIRSSLWMSIFSIALIFVFSV